MYGLSCFSPVSVHFEILITIKKLFLQYIYFIKNSQDFTAKRHLYHNLKGDVFTIVLKGLLLLLKQYNKLSVRQQKACSRSGFSQSLDHVDHL